MAALERSSTIVDDRAGFYMVPSASIAKARARLTGAHLTEALAGLACLARESFVQNGASRDEQQTLEANLDELARRILGVSRARALRILDNLVDAGALTKEAHRFDGTRRLPTKVTFVDLAYSFAYVSGPAFRALRADSGNGGAPCGALALYLTFVALGGEQRDEFPDGNRRIARASQPELAKLSGLSVSSVKRAVSALVSVGLVTEQPQPQNALKTKAVYHLVDPDERSSDAASNNDADRSQADRSAVHSETDAGSHQNRRTAPSLTVDRPQPDRSPAQGVTDIGSETNRPTAHSETDRRPAARSRAHVKTSQRTAHLTNEQIPLIADDTVGPADGGEGSVSEADELIETYRSWTRDVLGQRRAAAVYDAESWERAARLLLEQYDLDRLLSGIDRLRRDSLLADKATTLPAFALIAERAIARAAADRALADHRTATPNTSARATGPSWATAQALLRKAVSAFGLSGEDRALQYLTEHDPHLAAFTTEIGWRALARSSEEMTDVKFAYLEFCRHDRTEAA